MSDYADPNPFGENQAVKLYPALSKSVREALTIEAFASQIIKILIEHGDIDKYKNATEVGRTHGIYTTNSSRTYHSDDGEMTVHAYTWFTNTFDCGDEYIKNLVAERYPGFDEELYLENLKKLELEDRLNKVKEFNIGYHELPGKVINFLEDLVSDKIKEKTIYVCCDYEDENNIVDVIMDLNGVYHNDGNLRILSGEEIRLGIKYGKIRRRTYQVQDYLLGSEETDHGIFAIDRIEDLVKDEDAQRYVERMLKSKERSAKTCMFISEIEPKWFYGVTDGMKDILNSALFFDTREVCRKKRKNNTSR